MNLVAQAAILVAFPVAAAIIGAIISVVRPPGPRFVSGVQHFAAGVVTAALVGEIMPELKAEGHVWWAVLGFVLGAALVLALGAYGRRAEAAAASAHVNAGLGEALVEAKEGVDAAVRRPTNIVAGKVAKAAARTIPIGMLGAIVIDLLLDGVLVGLGVRLGSQQGIILTIALTLEILFLGLSVTAELQENGMSKGQAVLTCAVLGLMTAVGAIGGAALLGGVDTTVMSAVLGIGAAALLYLVVEELLVEAHEEKESVALGAMFFLGFVVIYILSAYGG